MAKNKLSSNTLLKGWKENKAATLFIKSGDSKLEKLASLGSKPFEEGVNKLVGFHESLTQSHELVDLINKIDDFGYDPSIRDVREDIRKNGKVDRRMLSRMESGFYRSLNNMTARLNTDFKRLSDEFDNAREQGEISAIAKRLQDVASHYLTLDKAVAIETNRSAKKADDNLANYSHFVDEKIKFDERLESFLGEYNPETVDFGNLVDLDHEISTIRRGYNKLTRKYGSWFETNIKRKPSVFGCYEERDTSSRFADEIKNWKSNYKSVEKTRQTLLDKISEIDKTLKIMGDEGLPLKDRIHAVKSVKLIHGQENLREIPVLEDIYKKLDSYQEDFKEQSHNYDFIHTTKAKIKDFTDHYHEVLERLNEEYHIDLDFVHWIKSIKLVEPDFLHSVSNIAHLAYDVSQLTTLEGLVRKGIEVAMNTIDGHLDDRFNEAKDIYDNHEDSHPPHLLEKASDILDEVTVIYKLTDSSTQDVENLKSMIHNKKKYHENQLKNASGGIARIIKESTTANINTDWMKPRVVESKGFFDIVGYFNELGGAPADYCLLRSALFENGKNKSKHWIDRLERVGELIEELPLAGNTNDLEYITGFEQGLQQTYENGIIGDYARKNSSYNEIAIIAISKVHDYVENSRKNLAS